MVIIAHRKLVKNLHIAIFFVVSFFVFGCKSSKDVVGSAGLDYQTQKSFEKVYFSANKQKVLGNKEKALELYNQALTIYPKSHATMYQLAKLYYKTEKYNEALYWAEKSVKANPSFNHWYSGQLAQFYNKFGKYEESAEQFSLMVENEPNVRKNYTEAASQFYNAKKYDKSISYLKEMQRRFGVELESASRLEYIYTSLGKKDEAIKALEALVETDPDNIKYLGFLAETYNNGGYTEKSIATLNKVLELEPETGKAYYALYTIYAKVGDRDLAVKNLKESFKYNDISLQQKLQSITPFFMEIHKNESSKNMLLELSDLLLEDYPKQLQPYMFRADIHGTIGQYQLARTYVKKAIKIDNSDFQLWSKLINLNSRLGDNEEQLKAVEEALELFPTRVQLYATQGYAYMGNKEYQKAVDIATEGLDLAVDDDSRIQLLKCLASAYGELENFEKADQTMDEILKINGYDATSLNNYAFSLAERKERLTEADSMINIALKLEPGNPFFLDTKAWILFAKKDYKQALRLLDKCMEIDPKNPEYYRHAKLIFIEIGNQTMANDMQQKIDALNENR